MSAPAATGRFGRNVCTTLRVIGVPSEASLIVAVVVAVPVVLSERYCQDTVTVPPEGIAVAASEMFPPVSSSVPVPNDGVVFTLAEPGT